jgi:parallel beta-helix repeat protein
MKRSYCTFLCALAILFLNIAIYHAQTVSISDAQIAAQNFLINYQTTNKNKLPSVQSAVIYKQQVIQSDKGEEIAYVFEMAPEGFIVTSTDNYITPILAYSFNGKFSYDENEENHLLHMIRKDLELRKSCITITDKVLLDENNKRWQTFLSGNTSFLNKADIQQWPAVGTTTTGGWIETTWTQETPYNDFCPLDLGYNKRSLTGCTATALAQIFNFQKYIGDLAFSSADKYTLTGNVFIDSDSTKNDFPSFQRLNTILNSIKNKYSSSQTLNNSEIAALNFATGIASITDYSYTNSGASIREAATGLRNKFGYSCSWLDAHGGGLYDTLKTNIINAYPAMLDIIPADFNGCWHAIVCDGYRTDELYHLNFGWGATVPNQITTCWYSLPEGMPAGYSIIGQSLLNIIPNNNKKSIDQFALNFGSNRINISSSAKYFTILNTSGQPLNVASIISGDQSFLISLDGNNYFSSIAPITINPNAEQKIYVKFTATEQKNYSSFLTIKYSNNGIKENCIFLKGVGISTGTSITSATVSGIWDINNSPYYINGDVEVATGSVLRINAGVKIFFTGHYKLSVGINSRITAIGTQQDMIEFTSIDTISGWHGLRINKSIGDTLIYCKFSHARKSVIDMTNWSSWEDAWENSVGAAVYIQGVYVQGPSNHLISNCLFKDNSCVVGSNAGAVAVEADNCTVSKCEFIQNYGGALKIKGKNNIVYGNKIAGNIGVALDIQKASCAIGNNIIYNNGKGCGSTLFIIQSDVSLINNSIVNNESLAMSVTSQSKVFGLNNIICGNINSIEIDSTSICDISYSNIEKSFPGIENIDKTPKFIYPTAGKKTSDFDYNADFNLSSGSPSINSGSNLPLFNDNDGSINDMGFTGGRGLFPSSLNLLFPVVAIGTSNDASTTSSNVFTFYNCSDKIVNLSCFTFSSQQFKLASSASAFNIIPHSLASIDLLFQPNKSGIDSSKVSICIQAADMNTSLDVQLIGKANNYTLLTGNISGHLKIDNSPYLLTEIVVLQNGSSLTIDPGVKIYANENCFLQADGTLVAEGTPKSNILFSASDKVWNGIVSAQGNVTLKYCIIEKTKINGINLYGGNILIENCRITNGARYGIFIQRSTNPIIRGNVIDHNSSWGIYADENSSPEIYNNTISKNLLGVLLQGNSHAIIKNNIIWGNNSTNIASWSTGNSELSYNCIQGDFPSFALDKGNNRYLDPQFVNLTQDDFHLSSTSPYIDSGTNNVPSTFYADFDSKQRIYDGNNDGINTIDLGAFEFGASDIMILPPVKPALLYPQNDVKNLTLELNLRWEGIQNCNTYNLQVSKSTAFTTLHIDTTFTESTRQIKLDANGAKYYWRVRGNNLAGYGNWSDTWNFTTMISAPTNLTLQRTALKEITLSWDDNLGGEDGYVIERRQSPETNYSLLDTLKGSGNKYIDKKVEQGQTLSYRIKAYTKFAESSYSNEASIIVVGVDEEKIPTEYSLIQNYPNPFNPATKIKFGLPENAITKLIIYDILGREVSTLLNQELEAGYHEINFDGTKLSSGVYFYSISASKFRSVKKLILMK